MGKYRILTGNIVSDTILSNHDLIINPTNPQMVAGAGVSGEIFKKAGVDILEKYTQSQYDIHYFSDNYKVENIMKVGDIRITPGFSLGMDIMFVQGPKHWEYDNSTQVLFNIYKKLLKVALNKGYKNILLPSLGTGEYGFEHSEIGKEVTKILEEFTKYNDINVDLVIFNEMDRIYY